MGDALGVKHRAGRMATVLVCLIGASMAAAAHAQEQRSTYDQALVDRWMTELSNWGRWGKDDELGTLNLITPEKRQRAMGLARKGVVVSMEQKVVLIPPPPQQVDDTPLAITFYDVHFKTMGPGDKPELAGWTSEVQRYHPHGYGTHVDALCHSSDGRAVYTTASCSTSGSPQRLGAVERVLVFGLRGSSLEEFWST